MARHRELARREYLVKKLALHSQEAFAKHNTGPPFEKKEALFIMGALTADDPRAIDALVVAQRVCSREVSRGENRHGGKAAQESTHHHLAQEELMEGFT